MKEASKAMARRSQREKDLWFKGVGIDIGAGPDCIGNLGYNCRSFDMEDGDANFLESIVSGSLDYIHSSHCLEHMVDVSIALANWIRVVRVGGYLIITIPDEELYEHGCWPSRFNSDHKWSFRTFSGKGGLPKHINIFELLQKFYKEVEVIKIERIEDNFNWNAPIGFDQTGSVTGPECAIELVLRKKR